jgi:hypothetical protein
MGKKQELMTWVPARHRWAKNYKGKPYAVTCKALGVPRSSDPEKDRDASRDAANAWWVAKQSQLEAEVESGAEERRAANDQAYLAATGELIRRGVAAGLDPSAVVRLAMTTDAQEIANPRPKSKPRENRTVAHWKERWLAKQSTKVEAGKIDHGRHAAYSTEMGYLARWLGEGFEIDALTGAKLEEFQLHLLALVAKRAKEGKPHGMAGDYGHGILQTTKQFVRWLAGQGLIPLPLNIDDRDLSLPKTKKEVEVFEVEELRTLLAEAKARKEKFYLWLLLMLNIGGYANDISEISTLEVDLEKGIVKRPRSKTPNGPKSVYRLWPETLELLRKYKATAEYPAPRGGNRLLLTSKDKPLVAEGRTDNVRSAYMFLIRKAKLECKKPLMDLRKTGASMLARHKVYRYYVPYFLGHSPRSMSDKSYVKPPLKDFFKALRWLRKKLLGVGSPEAVQTPENPS